MTIDKSLKAAHQPRLAWNGLHRPRADGRQFVGFYDTQAARQRLHDRARQWLAHEMPGYFSEEEGGQPVLDLLTFDDFDPLNNERSTSDSDVHVRTQDLLRAIGVEHLGYRRIVSPSMPGVVLSSASTIDQMRSGLSNCWSLSGNLSTLQAVNDRVGYGVQPYDPSTFLHMFDDSARGISVMLAAARYTERLQASLSRSRDLALPVHNRFSARRLSALRKDILRRSLDLSLIASDLRTLWSPEATSFFEVGLREIEEWPDEERRDEDFIAWWGVRNDLMLERLEADDKAYRDVLATAATLGAGAAANRLSRRALLVGATSLLVAVSARIHWDSVFHWWTTLGH